MHFAGAAHGLSADYETAEKAHGRLIRDSATILTSELTCQLKQSLETMW
jgi:hypothetical protein